jgi:hypothetical protein
MAVRYDGGTKAGFIYGFQSSLSISFLQSDGYKYLKYKSKTGWKIQALLFIAMENVGLILCEMMTG